MGRNKHSNIAIFIPHNGCPHRCAFCNQRTISGAVTQPTAKDVRKAVNTALSSPHFDGENAEIAFFGGSFTAIDPDYMVELLEAAHEFVAEGKVAEIIRALKERYPEESDLPKSFEEMKFYNSDLQLSTLDKWTKIAYQTKARDYLIQKGLLRS